MPPGEQGEVRSLSISSCLRLALEGGLSVQRGWGMLWALQSPQEAFEGLPGRFAMLAQNLGWSIWQGRSIPFLRANVALQCTPS